VSYDLSKLRRAFDRLQGCHDNSCPARQSGGQGTNGGCRCPVEGDQVAVRATLLAVRDLLAAYLCPDCHGQGEILDPPVVFCGSCGGSGQRRIP
jgi:DnaJ-class molecular chaperone